ncbi:MAG: molybdenum cofactor guanylyltransferase, partial [Armatimonadota bacterium]
RAMIERVYAALSAVCRKVVLVGDARGVPSALDGVPRVPDRLPALGPLGGLEALLGSNLDSEYLIAPCDLPEVVPDVFRHLVAPGVTAPAVLGVEGEEHIEPLVARYATSVCPILEDMIREDTLAMHELARRSRAQVVRVPRGLASALRNANAPEALGDTTAPAGGR